MTASIPSLDVLFRSPLVQRAYLRSIGLSDAQADDLLRPPPEPVRVVETVTIDGVMRRYVNGEEEPVRCVTESSKPPDPDAVAQEIHDLALRLMDSRGDEAWPGVKWTKVATLAYELGARVR